MSTTGAEGSEDVNDFLQRIKELGDRRDQEDEERNRKLEEEILQGRAERQARRAERARSISPTKSSPAVTPTSRTPVVKPVALSDVPSPIIKPRGSDVDADTAVEDAMNRLTGSSPTKEGSSPFEAPGPETARPLSIKAASPSGAMPSRNSPLSWQRRPESQASDRPRSRTLSMVATENAARSPKPSPLPSESTDEPTPSRDQIAQSLASKDPTWFKQTADRGLNSPAYRRNQVEDEDRSDHSSGASRGIQMPGMFAKPEKEELVDRSSSPSRMSTSSTARSSYSAATTGSGGLGSPITLTTAQRFEPPAMAMSPSQGRISPDRLDRPPSPTKGMGGFVQSAMMKRSDSVSKRWSVQSPACVLPYSLCISSTTLTMSYYHVFLMLSMLYALPRTNANLTLSQWTKSWKFRC
ncbi:ADP-ribosylation factor [Phlyctema vagabunda]|uniref:ADP-ribosylation factor n=1 Tax=Phlyctema vagabunda TaxID=108571 RepID=A0ABR4PRE4_9HELO